MNEKTRQRIAEIFQRNLENRLSVELSNGMLQAIFTILEEKQPQEPSKEDIKSGSE